MDVSIASFLCFTKKLICNCAYSIFLMCMYVPAFMIRNIYLIDTHMANAETLTPFPI